MQIKLAPSFGRVGRGVSVGLGQGGWIGLLRLMSPVDITTRGCKAPKCSLSLFWRPEVQDQDEFQLPHSFWGPGRNPPSSTGVCRLQSLPVHGLWVHYPSLCPLYVSASLSHLMRSPVTGVRALPHPVWPHFHLIDSAKTPLPNRERGSGYLNLEGTRGPRTATQPSLSI